MYNVYVRTYRAITEQCIYIFRHLGKICFNPTQMFLTLCKYRLFCAVKYAEITKIGRFIHDTFYKYFIRTHILSEIVCFSNMIFFGNTCFQTCFFKIISFRTNIFPGITCINIIKYFLEQFFSSING